MYFWINRCIDLTRMNSILTSINLVKTEYSEADFYNFWQLASEMVGLDVQDKKLAKIIEAIHKAQRPFQCKAEASTYQQIQFSTIFSLQKQALEFFNQGFILVCDDVTTWERLIIATAPKQVSNAVDWVCKVYKYVMNQTTLSALEVISHPHLAQDQELHNLAVEWEYTLRKTQKQLSNLDLPNHPLCNYLSFLTRKNGFLNIFNEIIEKLPSKIQAQTRFLSEYIPLLDGKNRCIEWFKKAVCVGVYSNQIRLGIHEALKFTPAQVVFCLKHSQIRPSLSHLLQSKTTNMTQQLMRWKSSNPLNILSYSQETVFCHPLLNDQIAQKYPEKIFPTKVERPTAKPIVGSRPTTISATGFNLLMQDPYGFYAKYILKLSPLERITCQSFAKEFGMATHKTIEIYLKSGFDAATKYIDTLRLSSPAILWKAKLQRILDWVRNQIDDLSPSEIHSEKDFQTTLGEITIKARIDALFFLNAGNLVVNFKTGTPPSKAEVINGYAPQLAIEMFLAGKTYVDKSVQAEFWQLKGTQPSGITSTSLAIPIDTLQKTFEKITSHYLIRNSEFLTCPWPSKTPKCNEYKNLERLI